VVCIVDPLKPVIVARSRDWKVGGKEYIFGPKSIAIQFRYAFLTDEQGFKVLDVTFPWAPKPVPGSYIPMAHHANDVYVARTYAYVAAGHEGLAIIDVERPEHPFIYQVFNGDGHINDARQVKVGSTNLCAFAYIADGVNGLQVVQLTDPETTPGIYGYSPFPKPKLIAHFHTHGPALAVSKGLDRDRAVDESGNQVAVFGRLGARPFRKNEMNRFYLNSRGLYTVGDGPKTAPEPDQSYLQYPDEPVHEDLQQPEMPVQPAGNLMLKLKFE
jgi:hypothetical protein